MKYKVEENDNEINIEVSESREKQDKLLESFQEWQEGAVHVPRKNIQNWNHWKLKRMKTQYVFG